MTEETLSREQLKFLEECNFEFCDRFTDADVEYKKIYDAGVPPPPIMHPWQRRNRFNNRDRPGGGRYNERGDYGNSRGEYGSNRAEYGSNRGEYGSNRGEYSSNRDFGNSRRDNYDNNYNRNRNRSYGGRETQHH